MLPHVLDIPAGVELEIDDKARVREFFETARASKHLAGFLIPPALRAPLAKDPFYAGLFERVEPGALAEGIGAVAVSASGGLVALAPGKDFPERAFVRGIWAVSGHGETP